MSEALKKQFRELFENEYPGMESLREKLINPLWTDIGTPFLEIPVDQKDKNKIKKITIFANQGSDINFVDVELSDTIVLKRNRATINRYITNKIVDIYQSALIFFHYTNDLNEWRISYIYKGENNTDRTNAKRYTYLCGKGIYCRTAAERFTELKKYNGYPNSDKLIEAFSVENLTKEFFGQLFNWYSEWACKVCKFPSDKCIAANAELTTEKNELNLIRLITRIMFVWFIKQKDLIPSWVFNRAELETLLSDPDLKSEKKGNYYNAVLQNLFFGALNKKIEERSFAEKSFDGVPNEQYGIKSYFRDDNKSSFFTLSHKEMQEHFEGVPFLNGGLFECLDYDVPHGKDSHKVHYVDGFSRNAERRAFVPNALFWSEDEANLGLIPIFSRYNFTVEESTPNDVQVALDPELLGKIFENLLGTFNPETKESARKESGSFYTPREIVSYMVNTSLASSLHEKVSSVSEEIIEKLTNDDKSDDEDIQLTESQIDELRKALVNIKIIDPACGSGAFPMGILNKLVEIHVLLNRLSASTHSDKNLYIKKGQFVNYTPNDELRINAEYLGEQKFRLSVNGNTENEVYTSQELAVHVKDIINKYNKKLHKNTIANLFSQGRIDDGKSFNSIKTKQEILQIVDADSKEIIWQYKTYNVENKFRKYRTEGSEQTASTETETEDGLLNYNSLYNLKTQIIQDSIFGVDIQPIAVQICKLRFFISLICEQPKTGSKENNYGYNPLPNLETKFVAANTLIGKAKKSDAMALFADQRIDNITKELLEIRKTHFSAKTAQEKKENREKDEQLRTELSKLLEEDNVYNPEDARQLAQWNPYDQTADASPFFDAEWMFGVKDGFDIVIGNPPYVQLQKDGGNLANLYEKQNFKTYAKTGDIYCLFYEKGCNLLTDKGRLCFITSNKWMRAGYGEKLRDYFAKNVNPKLLVDFAGVKVFESATVDTNILLFEKGKNEGKTQSCTATTLTKDGLSNLSEFVRQSSYPCAYSNSESWIILSPIEQSIKNKIEAVGVPLKDWDISINYGIKTGFNDAFIVNSAKRNEILANCKTEDERNRTAELIRPILRGRDIKRYEYSFSDLYLINTHNGVKEKNIPRIDIKDYPAIKKHLDEYWDKISTRADKGDTPYNLRNCAYMDEFNKPKIVWGNLNLSATYTLAPAGMMINAPATMIVPANESLLCILNSKLADYYIRNLGVTRNGGYFEYKPMFIEQLPVPKNIDKKLFSKFTGKELQNEEEIDRKVYELYGLDEKEVLFIEKY